MLNARFVGKLMKSNVLGMDNNLKDKSLTNLLPALLIVFTFVIDRVSKIYAINALQSGDLFVNDFLNFSLVRIIFICW